VSDEKETRHCRNVGALKEFLDGLPDTAQIAVCDETELEDGRVHRQWWGISGITYKPGEGVRIR
jgi:hypothetical protein